MEEILHQLRLVVFASSFARIYTSQMVVWDFFHQQYHSPQLWVFYGFLIYFLLGEQNQNHKSLLLSTGNYTIDEGMVVWQASKQTLKGAPPPIFCLHRNYHQDDCVFFRQCCVRTS